MTTTPDLFAGLDTPSGLGGIDEGGIQLPAKDGQIPVEHQKAIKEILDQVRRSERDVRYQQIKTLKRNELFWVGEFKIYWDSSVGDWQSIADGIRTLPLGDVSVDPGIYDKAKVNIYRAYGESVIGAVSNGVPHVRFFPSNPDKIEDINTADTFALIAEKIEQENEAEALMRRGMALLWNQGFIACYNYSHASEDYGTSKQKIFGAKNYEDKVESCPLCESEISSDYYEVEGEETPRSDTEILERKPEGLGGDYAEGLDTGLDQGLSPLPQLSQCLGCGEMVPPNTSTMPFQAPYVKEEKDIPKCRQILEFYGPLNVQIPYYARLPRDVGWVLLSTESHYAQIRDLYSGVVQDDGENLADKIQPGNITNDTWERWARSTYYDYMSSQTQLVTVQRFWVKPWMFEALGTQKRDLIEELKATYPCGLYSVFVNELFAEAYPEDLDEHWTFTLNPLEERINASPFGKFLIPVQEMINELIFLILETIEFGVPVTFVDDTKFDMGAINQSALSPGNMYGISRDKGESLSNYLHTTSTASLSKDVFDFLKALEFYAQLVSGAFPQIFGGATNNRTLGQDENARNQALQRLATAWRMLNKFWASVMSKAVKNHVDDMLEDETYLKDIGNSKISVEIKLENLTGEVGEVVPETNDQFPVSWSQLRDQTMKLFEMNNPQILQVLGMPQNVGFVKRVLGMNELYVPGDDDRNKQLAEIEELIKGQPVPNMMDPNILASSVPIEPAVDNGPIHIEVTRAFLSSQVGQFLKKYNPMAYENVSLHLQEHEMYAQQQAMMQAAAMAQDQGSEEAPPEAQ